MKHLALLSIFGLVLFLAVAGCESSGGGDEAADTSGGNGGDTGGGNGGDTGGGNGGPCEAPELPAPQNEPWTEYAHEGTTYTLNTCPEGLPLLYGAWAFYCPPEDCDEDALDPSYKELFTINGNTWTARMEDSVESGTVEGWFFCSDQPENDKKVKVFVVTAAEPDGVFGNTVGSVFSMDILGIEEGMKSFFVYQYEGIATGETDDQFNDAFYCKVGQEMEDGCCANPFE